MSERDSNDSPPPLETIWSHVSQIEREVDRLSENAVVSQALCRRVERDYLDFIGFAKDKEGSSDAARGSAEEGAPPSLSQLFERRCERFETYLIEKVRSEAAEAAAAAAARAPGGRAAMEAEALRGRCASLGQRVASLEGKMAALVSDLVYASQSTRRDVGRLEGGIAQLQQHQQQSEAQAAACAGRHDLADARTREFVRVLTLCRDGMQDMQRRQEEYQVQTYTVLRTLTRRLAHQEEALVELASAADRHAAELEKLRRDAARGKAQSLAERTARSTQQRFFDRWRVATVAARQVPAPLPRRKRTTLSTSPGGKSKTNVSTASPPPPASGVRAGKR